MLLSDVVWKIRFVILVYRAKNATSIFEIFKNIKLHQEKYKHFLDRFLHYYNIKALEGKLQPWNWTLLMDRTKGISVDSHVLKCAMALQWVHPQCTTPESIQASLQEWVSPCMWPHVNMVFASFGQLFSDTETTRNILDIAMRDFSTFQQLYLVLLPLVHLYQPNMLF